MIVLDEDLREPELAVAFRRWYPGRVVALPELRPGTRIKDADAPALLRSHRGCTFVTVNWADFWLRIRPDRRFAVICARVPQDHADEVPRIVRSLFRQSGFGSRRGRCGKVFLATTESVRFYERLGGEVQSVAWQ